MRTFQLLEKGQTGIKLISNNTEIETIIVYKIYKNSDGGLVCDDITEDEPEINDIADGLFKQYIFDVPDEDCYILTVFNGKPQLFRVGVPTLQYITYTGEKDMSIDYKIHNFDGDLVTDGTMSELDHGVYYYTPDDTGDFIFTTSVTPAIPVHTPYVISSVGMSGKIVFQKDQWMLLAIPVKDKKIADVISDIEDKYDIKGEDAFLVFSAYPATNTQSKEMLDFKPNYTPEDTKYNFQLVYEDEDSDGNKVNEVTGFWCKTLDYALEDEDELIVYDWDAS